MKSYEEIRIEEIGEEITQLKKERQALKRQMQRARGEMHFTKSLGEIQKFAADNRWGWTSRQWGNWGGMERIIHEASNTALGIQVSVQECIENQKTTYKLYAANATSRAGRDTRKIFETRTKDLDVQTLDEAKAYAIEIFETKLQKAIDKFGAHI